MNAEMDPVSNRRWIRNNGLWHRLERFEQAPSGLYNLFSFLFYDEHIVFSFSMRLYEHLGIFLASTYCARDLEQGGEFMFDN